MTKEQFAARLKQACASVISAEQELTEIDSKFGDADHGLTMTKIAKAISDAVDQSDGGIQAMLDDAATAVMSLNGGSAVPLWNTWLDGMQEAAPEGEEIDVPGLQAVFSQALEVAVTVNVLLPEPSQGIGLEGAKAQEPPRVMYLLHGYSDDQSIWMRRTSVERYCAKYNLAVIMPAVNHSYYANELQGERYWDYVSQELPQMMHSMFRLSQAPGTELVAGLSMGGYGAMKLALTYPERFAAAASFSGAVDAEALLRKREARPTMRRAFGTAKAFHGSENDLFHLMEENAQAPHKPRLYVACGTEDFLYPSYTAFKAYAQEIGLPATFEEEAGYTHEWAFWDLFIQKALDFFEI